MLAIRKLQRIALTFSIISSALLCIFGVFKNKDIITASWVPAESIENLKSFTFYYAIACVGLILFWKSLTIRIFVVGLSFLLAYALGFTAFFVPIFLCVSAFLLGAATIRLYMVELTLSLVPIAVLVGLSIFYVAVYVLSLTSFNTLHVYTVLVLLPYLFFQQDMKRHFRKLAGECQNFSPLSRFDLLKLSIVLFCALLHIHNVLRPEFDFDALAAHLMIPHFVKAHGSWSFDYNQFVFGVNQLGADFLYTFVYVLSDERGVRFFNFIMFTVLSLITYNVCVILSSRSIALLASIMLFSCPLMVTQTSTLHIEGVWSAFLLGLFYVLLLYSSSSQERKNLLPIIGIIAGMTLAIKMPSLFYLPFFAVYLLLYDYARAGVKGIANTKYLFAFILSIIFGFVPYLYCFFLTGNPVFPYFNGIFKSPFFYKASDFNNPIFNKPLSVRTMYDMTFHGQWYLESLSYPLSLYFLFFFVPVIIFSIFEAKKLAILSLSLLVFVSGSAIYYFQSYLRYVFPSFIFLIILASALMHYLSVYVRSMYFVSSLVIFLMVPVSIMRFPDAAHAYREFNWERALSSYVKEDFIYQRPHQVLYDYLNTKYKTHTAVLLIGSPLSTGLDGTALVNAWYNPALADFIARAQSKDDIVRVVSSYGITHIVYDGVSEVNAAFKQFMSSSAELVLDHYSVSLYKIDYRRVPSANLLSEAPLEAGYIASVDLKNARKFMFELELSSNNSEFAKWSLVFDWKGDNGESLATEHIYNGVGGEPYMFEFPLTAPEHAKKLVISLPNPETEQVTRAHYALIKIAESGKLKSYEGAY